jgi:two-component system cell cycle sensor histidine kinase/response regulator CckA
VTYSIIKNHGGHIAVESTPGSGAIFTIYLPASEQQSALKEEVSRGKPLPGKGRILVMDDEQTIRSLLHRILSDSGYEVELTGDGAEALESYKAAREAGQPFAAVILDLTIPGGMGGKETIKKLLEIDPEVKAIVSSGYASDAIMSEYQQHGFSAVVAKPYDIHQLTGTLHNVLCAEPDIK